MMPEQHDQIVSRRRQQQAKGIGQEAVTTQSVGGETVLEFLDAFLAFAASVIEGEDLLGQSPAVGDHVRYFFQVNNVNHPGSAMGCIVASLRDSQQH